MITLPAQVTLVSANSDGYAVVDSIASIQVGLTIWISKAGQPPLNCVITELQRAGKKIGLRAVSQAGFGRTNVAAYSGGYGVIDIPHIYGPLFMAQYTTAGMPSAATHEGAIAYDTTLNQFVYSNGSAWSAVAGGSSVTSLGAVGGTPNAYGGTVAGTVLTLAPANAANPGLVDTNTQTWTGKKVLTGPVSATALVQTSTADIYLAVSSGGSDAYNLARDPIHGGNYASYPFATVDAAVAACPPYMKHNLFINLVDQTFAGFEVSGMSGGGKLYYTGTQHIEKRHKGIYVTGTTATAVITGHATGTVGAGTSPTNVIKPSGGSNWVASALRGLQFEVTGGGGYISADYPVVRPIKENTTTSLTVDAIAGMDDTTTFKIVTAGTTIQDPGGGEAYGILVTNNFCPVILRNLNFDGVRIQSSDNNIISIQNCYFDTAPGDGIFVSSEMDAVVEMFNNSFVANSSVEISNSSKRVDIQNNWGENWGGIYISDANSINVRKLDSEACQGYALSIANANKADAEVVANNSVATGVYLENIQAFTAVGSNLLSGSGNGVYGLEIAKGGNYSLAGCSITGTVVDSLGNLAVRFKGRNLGWDTFATTTYGILEDSGAIAQTNYSSLAKILKYGNHLFDGSVDFSSRVLLFGFLNQSANDTVVTLTGYQEYNPSNSYIYEPFAVATGDQAGASGGSTTTSVLYKPGAAANWTANDLDGQWVRITSGTAAGRYRQIASNTTTSLTFAGTTTITGLAAGDTFEILSKTAAPNSRSSVEVVCNSANAKIVLPDAAAVGGHMFYVINRGANTVTIVPGTNGGDGNGTFTTGTVDGTTSAACIAGSARSFMSLIGSSGKDFWTVSYYP